MDKPITEAKARAKELTRAVIGLLGARSATPLTLGATVADIMTRDAKSCCRTERLDAVAKVLWDKDCGIVPITDEQGTVVGVLTDRDLCMAAFTRGLALGQIEAQSVISGTLHSCRESESLDRLVAILRSHRVRRLPVVDAVGKLRGVASLADLAAHVVNVKPPAAHGQEILASLLACLSRREDRPEVRANHVA